MNADANNRDHKNTDGTARARALTGFPAPGTAADGTLPAHADGGSSTGTLSTLRRLPKTVWILFGGSFLNKFGSFVIPFLAIYLTRTGFSAADAGMAISAYGLGQLAAAIVGGHLADSVGRRRTIVLSMFSTAAAMLLLSQARTVPWVLLLTVLTGLTGELYRPASSALLTDRVPAGGRVTAFSAYRLAFNAGWAFGPATAGFLAGYSFLYLFVGDALTSALFGVVAWKLLPEGLGLARPAGQAPWSEGWVALRRDPALQRMLLSSFCMGMVFWQMATTFGVHVTTLGYSDTVFGLLLSVNGILIVCFELPLTELTRRFPARAMIVAGYLLTGTGFALNGLARTIPQMAGAMVIFTLGEMVTSPVFSARIANLAPAHLRGRYMGFWALTGAVALMVGPNLGLRIYQVHPPAYWLSGAVLSVIGAAIVGLDRGRDNAK